jgi:hypothetical protein
MVRICTLLLKYPSLIILLAMLYDAFVELLGLEEKLVDPLNKSDYTAKIREADNTKLLTRKGMQG